MKGEGIVAIKCLKTASSVLKKKVIFENLKYGPLFQIIFLKSLFSSNITFKTNTKKTHFKTKNLKKIKK